MRSKEFIKELEVCERNFLIETEKINLKDFKVIRKSTQEIRLRPAFIMQAKEEDILDKFAKYNILQKNSGGSLFTSIRSHTGKLEINSKRDYRSPSYVFQDTFKKGDLFIWPKKTKGVQWIYIYKIHEQKLYRFFSHIEKNYGTLEPIGTGKIISSVSKTKSNFLLIIDQFDISIFYILFNNNAVSNKTSSAKLKNTFGNILFHSSARRFQTPNSEPFWLSNDIGESIGYAITDLTGSGGNYQFVYFCNIKPNSVLHTIKIDGGTIPDDRDNIYFDVIKEGSNGVIFKNAKDFYRPSDIYAVDPKYISIKKRLQFKILSIADQETSNKVKQLFKVNQQKELVDLLRMQQE